MAERYEDQHRRERDYRLHDRGLIDRAGDEVRSWFGDDDAERRRQLDDRYGYRDRGYYSSYEDRYPYRDRGGVNRDRPDGGYRPDGWRGMNYPSSPTYGNRDMPFRGDERGPRNFAGLGPRGYQRSDNRINEDVCDCLCDSADVDARNIDVVVANGEVTLNGSVSDRDQKRRAEDLIEHVSGVREVHNNLRIGSASAAAGEARPSAPSGASAEQPGNVLGVGAGAPDRAASAGRR